MPRTFDLAKYDPVPLPSQRRLERRAAVEADAEKAGAR